MLHFHRQVFGASGACSALVPTLSRGFSNKSDIKAPTTTNSEDKYAALDPKTKESSPPCECRGDASPNRGVVSVGIVGGGMTPMYTALLLKQARIIKRVHVVDATDANAGAAFDAGHIDTSTKIKYFKKKYILEALRDMDIIALMDENDFDMGKAGPCAQFMVTSTYARSMAEKMVQACPTALVAVMARPVTSMLPLVSEVYKCAGWWDPDRIIGSLAIDTMRIDAMTANLLDLNPAYLSVPLVGGADACTIVPLLSQARPVNQFTKEQEYGLVHRLRSADNELAHTVQKGPKLSMGAAASKLIATLAAGQCGFTNAITSAFVRSNALSVCRFFATELQFGPNGVKKNFGLPKVSPRELSLLEQSIPLINEHVDLAMNMIYENKKAKLKG